MLAFRVRTSAAAQNIRDGIIDCVPEIATDSLSQMLFVEFLCQIMCSSVLLWKNSHAQTTTNVKLTFFFDNVMREY